MLNRFDRLNLRTKIAAGFAALIVLALAADVALVAGHRQALDVVDTFIERDNRIAELTLKSSAMMLKARRNEKDFLLKARDYGFEEAQSRYVTLMRTQLAGVRENMAAVRALTVDPGMAAQALAIEHVSSQYEAGFLRVVELHARLGRRDAGLEGQICDRARAIEALLGNEPPEQLTSGLLALRRTEKEFFLRGLSTDAEDFNSRADRYKKEIGRSTLPLQRKQGLLRLTDEYQRAFREYVSVDEDIEMASQVYLELVHAVEPQLDRLHVRAGEAAAQTRAVLQRRGVVTTWVAATAGLGAMLLGIGVAIFISRNVNRSLRECVDFAGSLAAGDLSARVRTGRSAEFGVLTGSLNRMADALQAACDRQEEQAAELHRLNRALRVLSQCNETLVRATNEAELVQAICRHAVEIGGYRLAWVGYARHDPLKTVELVAHAGSDLDYVERLNLTWGVDDSRRGVGGSAIRGGRAVVARHIAHDPVFERWRDDALSRGLESCIALPLRGKNATLGTLSIYAGEPDAFDVEEVKVLQELADDLAYGIASLRETEERKRFERELERQATVDTLTGLANRFTLEAMLAQSLADARRQGYKLALMFVDLDRFKFVNDTFGHGVGDRLLIEVAGLLRGVVRESDTVARLGGDEFVILVKGVNSAGDAATVATKVIASIGAPLLVGEHEMRLSASIGISVFPDDGDDVAAAMKNADTALHHAKSLGGNSFRFFAPEMNARITLRFAMEADLRRALDRGELLMHFQPKVDLASGAISGAEALVRWCHPDKGMVSPTEFIPLAEETGLIEPLGEWVISNVCTQVRRWIDAGVDVPPVAVNLSARQLRQPNLVQMLEQTLLDNGLAAQQLELEITESAVMHDVEAAVATLGQLKALGLRLSLDDFGTGYSSLGYLKRFPIDHLKIDQSFVRDITTDPDDAAICRAVIGLAHTLKLKVIAEGVETEAQMNYLRRQRCDEMQGYYFSRPLPAAGFAALLAAQTKLALPLAVRARPEPARTDLLSVGE